MKADELFKSSPGEPIARSKRLSAVELCRGERPAEFITRFDVTAAKGRLIEGPIRIGAKAGVRSVEDLDGTSIDDVADILERNADGDVGGSHRR
jgi:hypothetical protein